MSEKTDAMLYKPKPVEINGVKYKRRRLGFEDGIRLVNLGFAAIGPMADAVDLDKLAGSEAIMLLGQCLESEDTKRSVLEFMKDVLVDFPLTTDEMLDPDKFPLGSETAILVSLMEDKDVAAFFDSVRKLWKLRAKLKGTKKPKKK